MIWYLNGTFPIKQPRRLLIRGSQLRAMDRCRVCLHGKRATLLQWNGHGHHGRDAVPRRVFRPPKINGFPTFGYFFRFHDLIVDFSWFLHICPDFLIFPGSPPPSFPMFLPFYLWPGGVVSGFRLGCPGLDGTSCRSPKVEENIKVYLISAERRGSPGSLGWLGDRDRPGMSFHSPWEKRMKPWGVQQPWRMMGVEWWNQSDDISTKCWSWWPSMFPAPLSWKQAAVG